MDWESLCTNCGLCCHEKVVLPDMLIIDLDKACEFYDEKTHLCSVYDERFKKCKRCRKVNIFMAMFSPSLPPVCGYVRFMELHHLRFSKKREFFLSDIPF